MTTTAETGASPSRLRHFARLSFLRDYGIVFSFIALFVVLAIASGPFATRQNLENILDQWSSTTIIAVGMTFVIIAGGFDLSVGSIFAVSGVVAALTATHIGAWPSLLLGVAVGLGCGIVNGVVTTVGRVNPFITTLATSIMFAGVALILTNGNLVSVISPESFTTLGRGKFITVPYTVWLLLAWIIACGILLSRSTFGRAVYATGGNAEAARLSGINIGFVRAATFAISGTAAGIGGVISTSRVGTGEATSGGLQVALDAVAGIVIGGTSIAGGTGAIWRTVLGVLMLAMIGNGFNLLNINSTYQQIIEGAIILLAVGIDAWSRRSS
jgi:ribose transport system permease protein